MAEEGESSVLLDFTNTFKKKEMQNQQQPVKPWLARRKQQQQQQTTVEEHSSFLKKVSDDGKENNDVGEASVAAHRQVSRASFSSVNSSFNQASPAGSVGSALGVRQGDTLEQDLAGSGLIIGGLNTKLAQLGYPPLDADDLPSVIVLVQGLIRDAQIASENAHSYESAAHQSNLETRRYADEIEALTLQLKCARQDKAGLENQLALISAKAKKDKTASDRWIKELQVTNAKMEGQQKGWQAALNRKEAEFERLQKRMQMLQSQRDKTIKRAMEMKPPPVVDEQQHTKEDCMSLSEAEDLATLERSTESGLLQRVSTLCEENERLRGSVSALQGLLGARNMRMDMAESKQKLATERESEWDSLRLHPNMSMLPTEALAEQIEKVRQRMTQLLDQETAFANDAASPAVQVEKLEKQLEQARDIIEEQDRLLQMSMFHGIDNNESEPAIDEAQLLRAQRDLSADKEYTLALQKRCEEDREMLLKEAQRLDQERHSFEQQKVAFHSKKTNSSHDPSTPSTPSLYDIVSTPVTGQKTKKMTQSKLRVESSAQFKSAIADYGPTTPPSTRKSDSMPTERDLEEFMGIAAATPATKQILREMFNK